MGLAAPVIARALKECERALMTAEGCAGDPEAKAGYTLAAKNAAGVYLALIQADATLARARVGQ